MEGYRILVVPVRSAGSTFSKEQLIRWVWPDVIVGESGLPKLVGILRAAPPVTVMKRLVDGAVEAQFPTLGVTVMFTVRALESRKMSDCDRTKKQV